MRTRCTLRHKAAFLILLNLFVHHSGSWGQEPFSQNLMTPYGVHFHELKPQGHGDFLITGEDPFLVISYPDSVTPDSVLSIQTNRITPLQDFGIIQIFVQTNHEAFVPEKSIDIRSSVRDNHEYWIYRIPLIQSIQVLGLDPDAVTALRIDFPGSSGGVFKIHEFALKSTSDPDTFSSLQPNNPESQTVWSTIKTITWHLSEFSVLIIILWAVTVLPSLLLASKFKRNAHAFIAFFGFMVTIPLISFLLFDLHKYLISEGEWAQSGHRLLFQIAPLLALSKRSVRQRFFNFLNSNKFLLLIYHFTVFFALVLVGYKVFKPSEHLTFIDVAHTKTFSTTVTHDNAFQYYNSLAIGSEGGFGEYYGNGRLSYNVNDRQILPGIIGSGHIKALQSLEFTKGNRFSTFVIISVLFNSLILIPLGLFLRKAIPYHRALILACCITHFFFICNIYYSWFKMAGGAYFLFGLYLAIFETQNRSKWIFIGLLWGIAANMHGSLVLAYPLTFAALLLHHKVWKKELTEALWIASIPAMVILLLIPWNVVKNANYEDHDTLARQFLVSRWSPPNEPYPGLVQTLLKYATQADPSEELTFRLQTFKDSFALGEYQILVARGIEDGWKTFLYLYAKYEIQLWGFILLPSLIFLLSARITGLAFKNSHKNCEALAWSWKGILLSLLGVYFVMLLGRDEEGINFAYNNWHLPYGFILLFLVASKMTVFALPRKVSQIVLVLLLTIQLLRILLSYEVQTELYGPFLVERLKDYST